MTRSLYAAVVTVAMVSCDHALANVALPSVFTDHMVLQRDKPVPVWGWASPGEKVNVTFAGQSHSTTANQDGKWRVQLDALTANSKPQSLTVEGENKVTINDILVGEVWICSGQSNMQWSVGQAWNADLAIRAADNPQIRLLTNNNAGVQKPVEDFEGSWQVCTPESVPQFSAVGYFFGLQLHQILKVPIGLIDNAWGGSSCEAWVQRDRLDADPDSFGPLMARWAADEAKPELKEPYDQYEAALLDWQSKWIESRKSGATLPHQPKQPKGKMVGQHRPANLFNSRVYPLIPFATQGTIWYQGESNAGRAFQYRTLFPLMIRNWRDAWNQGDFSFYWVQLADFRAEKNEPAESDWAELREAQTMTLDTLPKTGEAVIIDIGEAADIHPRNKEEVGRRLARLALAQDYGIELAHRSPRFDKLVLDSGKAVLTFNHRGGGLRTVDAKNVLGFTIAGKDRQWHPAQAKLVNGTKIEVWHQDVAAPVAVRYAWADNPVCNVFTREGLPLTPFRTDDWPGVTDQNR